MNSTCPQRRISCCKGVAPGLRIFSATLSQQARVIGFRDFCLFPSTDDPRHGFRMGREMERRGKGLTNFDTI